MKMFARAGIAVAGLIFTTIAAQATPTETLTWSGTVGYGSNGSPAQFAGAGGNGVGLAGDAFTIQLIYDPATLTGDTCSGPNTYCNWVFGASGITEKITVKGSTETYTSPGPGGSLGIGVSSDGAINLSIGGTPQFGLNISGTTPLFGSNANIEDFNIASTSVTGSFGSSGLTGGAQVGGNGPFTFNAVYSSGATSVPEPISVSLFGAGLAGMAAIRRRKKAKLV